MSPTSYCCTVLLTFDKAAKLTSWGIDAVAINSDVLMAAQNEGTTTALWNQVRQTTVLLMSPELLRADSVRTNLRLDKVQSEFKDRCTVLVCDEAHLVYEWGRNFRKAYLEIGVARNRLHSKTRLLLLTATLREGKRLKTVLDSFGLKQQMFFDMHRSNLRPEIRVCTLVLKSSLTNFHFPDLQWVVGLQGITIIFVRDRGLGLRIALFLRRCDGKLATRVRKCDALNDRQGYDEETMEMAKDIETINRGLVLVATDVLTTGMDIEGVRRVLILEPVDFDEEIQKQGRLLRNKSQGEDSAEAYVYVSEHTMKMARQMVSDDTYRKDQTVTAESQADKPRLELAYAERLVAPCPTAEQNRQYANPLFGQPPCSCPLCPKYSTQPVCRCSGCDETMFERDKILQSMQIQQTAAPTPEAEAVTRFTQEITRTYLTKLDDDLFMSGVGNRDGGYTPGNFVPVDVIAEITLHLLEIDSLERLRSLVSRYALDDEWVSAIFDTLRDHIIPAISQYHQRRQAEKTEQQAREQIEDLVEDLRKLREKGDLLTLQQCIPVLEAGRLTLQLSRAEMDMNLHWHRQWKPDLPKPWRLRTKSDVLVVLKDAVSIFHQEGKALDGVRVVIEDRIQKLDSAVGTL